MYGPTYGVVSKYDIGALRTLDNIDANTFLAALVPPVTMRAQEKGVRKAACGLYNGLQPISLTAPFRSVE
jgi:hypothetical protein